MQIEADRATDPAVKARLDKTIADWKKTIERYKSDPASKEGRKELAAQGQGREHNRDLAMARYHHYEVASAAFQIGIVLASAEVITAMAALGWFAGVLGIIGLGFTAIGLWAPHAVHLF